jgi:hypothetical protein
MESAVCGKPNRAFGNVGIGGASERQRTRGRYRALLSCRRSARPGCSRRWRRSVDLICRYRHSRADLARHPQAHQGLGWSARPRRYNGGDLLSIVCWQHLAVRLFAARLIFLDLSSGSFETVCRVAQEYYPQHWKKVVARRKLRVTAQVVRSSPQVGFKLLNAVGGANHKFLSSPVVAGLSRWRVASCAALSSFSAEQYNGCACDGPGNPHEEHIRNIITLLTMSFLPILCESARQGKNVPCYLYRNPRASY